MRVVKQVEQEQSDDSSEAGGDEQEQHDDFKEVGEGMQEQTHDNGEVNEVEEQLRGSVDSSSDSETKSG